MRHSCAVYFQSRAACRLSGSIATDMGRTRHVRFPTDRTADIAGGPFRAKFGLGLHPRVMKPATTFLALWRGMSSQSRSCGPVFFRHWAISDTADREIRKVRLPATFPCRPTCAGGTCPFAFSGDKIARQPFALFLTCSIQTSFSGRISSRFV